MIVTFISQCQKRSLNKTRRVLDAFANRIGDRTWQTPITEEGLKAVKKLLAKHASKNTAVACHRIKSRRTTNLEWIVGNRDKFNHLGHVPVNQTKQNLIKSEWENDWHYLPLISAITALSALLHDWGKASDLFQKKLKQLLNVKGDPIRHEWISLLFFKAFVGNDSDEQWLSRLANGKINLKKLSKEDQENPKPLKDLPKAAQLIAWLIVTHHRLPVDRGNKYESKKPADHRGDSALDIDRLFKKITKYWDYDNYFDENEYNRLLKHCFKFSGGMPADSPQWLKRVKKWSKRLLDELPLMENAIDNDVMRPIMIYARLSLMLGDHYYSSLPAEHKERLNIKEINLFANTDNNGELKQGLDEHLSGVAGQALRNVHKLPFFEATNANWYAHDIKPLKKKSHGVFSWQDKAVVNISQWLQQNKSVINAHNYGFFAVNMASTGKGKTFANAKIMRTLSYNRESLRFILALGLRTLTLQTGDEYRDRIGLDDSQLAVLIGSTAIKNLHEAQREGNHKERFVDQEAFNGSESSKPLLSNELGFVALVPESGLDTILRNRKDRQFLYAPVLSCTIDHLMSATEATRGGRYILPMLRLMSSDLVIDEVDGFDGNDLIAIGRLIHLAAMLGRKVMISSATIPPDLAKGYFNVYQHGWSIYATMRDKHLGIGCAWIDEFKTNVEMLDNTNDYEEAHQQFVEKRLKKLLNELTKRKATIMSCDNINTRLAYYEKIFEAININHNNHCFVDKHHGKKVSFGVVRMSNINPCIELTKYLLNPNLELPEDTDIRVMAYHSQQVLIMRNAQEQHLDKVLKRSGSKCPTDDELIQSHLKSSAAKNIIFILVATPVEEVGRDHDLDWTVIEPSSYRSFVQMAGRVLRHRDIDVDKPNVIIMQKNLRAIENKDVAFKQPGYESRKYQLDSHNIDQLVDQQALADRLDATFRIQKSAASKPKGNLADLEHHVIEQLLSSLHKKGPESMQGWLNQCWWMTGVPQQYTRFRQGAPQLMLYLYWLNGELAFYAKNTVGQLILKHNEMIDQSPLSEPEQQRLWMQRDYEQLLLQSPKGNDLKKAAAIFGEISLPIYGDINDVEFVYIDQLGMYRGHSLNATSFASEGGQ